MMPSINPPSHLSRQKGFTLIELTLYVSLMSMFLLALFLFLTAIFEAREKQQIMAEVEQQGIQIMQTMTRAINRAESISVPMTGEDAASLTLAMYEVSENPTVFNISDATLMITLGAGWEIPLTNDRVTVSWLVFRNISVADTPGSLRIIVTLVSRPKPGGRTVFTYTKTFQTTASLRRP